MNPPSIVGDDITSDGRSPSPSELILEAFGEASALFMSNPKPGTSQTMPEHALVDIATRLHDALFVSVEGAAKVDLSYEDQVKDEPNRAMRKASGEIDDKRDLVAFLYLLGRNSMPLGAIEDLVREATQSDDGSQYTNGWLARWAQYTADRLGVRKPIPFNEGIV